MQKKLGRYRLLEELGRGGMGVVYRARDEALGREVAVKTILAELADETTRGRLEREARAAASVSHPNVCQIYEIAEADGELFVAMELLEGVSLAERVVEGPLPLLEAVDVARSILAALEALHAQGFVHRDLKPSNVFLTPHGVKLLDFGLAKPLGEELEAAGSRLTMTGALLGTPAFMAPEQWAGKAAGPPTDLFAMGALLFEMLTGDPAFQGRTMMDVYHAIVHEQPPALTGSPAVEALDRVIQRALAKEPAARYAQAGHMEEDLAQALTLVDEEASPQVRSVTRLLVLPFRQLRADDETSFLAVSLPEAIVGSLSSIETLSVRAHGLASTTPDAEIDAQALAAEVDVDALLVGSLVRAGDRLRVQCSLLATPGGETTWSETTTTELGDLFALQDELAHRIVDQLAIPLSARDRQTHGDRPSSGRAYEFYLRANQISYNHAMLASARDLYLRCLEEDPDFAPAWARLGRVYRVLAKYGHGDVEEQRVKAREAFDRALALNPDLSIGHSLLAYHEIEEQADAPKALRRLLERVHRRAANADLYVGLVVACRFSGLFDASVAAHDRARRLDPGTRTSVAFTYWMMGDYEHAIQYDDEHMRYVTHYALPLLGRTDEAIASCRKLESRAVGGLEQGFVVSTRAALEGDRDACMDAARTILDSSFEDPEGLYFVARSLLHVGALDEGLAGLGRVMAGGLCCPSTFRADPWLDAVREHPTYLALLERADAGHAEGRRLYEEAGGERLLGVPV